MGGTRNWEIRLSASRYAAVLMAVFAIAACTAQQEEPTGFRTGHITNPFGVVETEGRGRGFYLARATKCGADPKKIAAAQTASTPSRTDPGSKEAYERALARNYDRAMREETVDDRKCDMAKVDRTTADLFPPRPDPSKMNRRQREQYYAEIEEARAQRARREASAALQEQARAAEADRQAQFERQAEQQERLIRLQSALQLQNQIQQQNVQQQMQQQQNMNNLQQYYQDRATNRPTVNCNSVSAGVGAVYTTCQ